MSNENCLICLAQPEISLKSGAVQSRMYSILKENIALSLKNNSVNKYSIKNKTGRIFIKTKEVKKALKVLKNCFGIYYLFPTFSKKIVSLKEAEDFALNLCKKELKGEFAIRAKSFDKKIKSKDIEISLGSKILEAIPKTKVNLSKPEKTCNILLFEDDVFVYFEGEKAVNGLPVNSQGKVALYISNKNDSEKLAKDLLENGCLPLLIGEKEELEKIDLKNYNSYVPLERISLEKAKELFEKEKVRAFFSDARSIEEKKRIDSLLEEKSFAPLLLNY
jgi:hypothetical protein